MRTADIVFHRPSEETWVVAWADEETGDMAPCGWPTCQARIADCDLVKAATDAEFWELVERVAASGRTDAGRAHRIAERLRAEEPSDA